MEKVSDLQNFLNFEQESLKSLDLPTLKKIKPVFDEKHKELSRTLEKLETHRNKLKQTLSGFELKKIEQKKILAKRKQAFMELGVKENKVQQGLAKANVMYPIYQFQMTHFLNESPAGVNTKSEDDTKYPNWSAMEESLLVKKQKLESKLEENQEVINSFVNTYLN